MRLLLLPLFLLCTAWLYSQNVPCESGEMPADDCDLACTNCNINGYSGTSFGYTASGNTAGFCGAISNDQWIAFVAQRTSAIITLIPSNCQSGDGLQMALYSAEGCMDTPPIQCDGGQTGGGSIPLTISTGLEIGKTYLLRIDGYISDICDFTIVVNPASAVETTTLPTPPPITGPAQACPKAEALYSIPLVNDGASAYTWTASGGATINGKSGPVVVDKTNNGSQVLVRLGNFNSVVSVKPTNTCGSGNAQTKQVLVSAIPVTVLPAREVCTKQYPITLPWGEVITTPVLGTTLYSKTLKSSLGCDSTVRISIKALPALQTNLGTKVLCEGDSIQVCGKYYKNPGAFTSVCTAWKGCDSIIQFTIERPKLDLKGGGSLNCFNGAVPLEVLNSNGTAVWKNQAGDVVGMNKTYTATTAGTYTVSWTESSGGKTCTINRDIVIKENDTLRVSVLPPATLTCAQTTVALQASANMFVNFNWTGPFAFTVNQSVAIVQNPGVYTVTASTGGGCTASQQIVVVQDIAPPLITAVASANCDATISLTANTGTPGIISYSWSGPGNFAADTKSTVTILEGIYEVEVAGNNGCTASSAVFATFNAQPPVVAAAGGRIACTNGGMVKLSLTVNTNQPISVLWTGPNNFTSSSLQPTVTIPGVYTATVTNTVTKCIGVDTAIVTGDASAFSVTATGGELNCLNAAVVLRVNAVVPSVSYAWSGPGGFVSMLQNPVVMVPGTYTVTVTNLTNGCTATATAIVVQNTTGSVAASISGSGTISCANPKVVLTAVLPAPVSSYQWSGPGGFTSTLGSIEAGIPGLYSVTVTSTNGCTGTASIAIQSDLAIPTVSISGANIFCTRPALMTATSNAPSATFNWTGPNGFTSTQAQFSTIVPGVYQVTVTNPANGCTNSTTVQVDISNPPVIQSINSGVLTCLQTSVKLVPIQNLPIINYQWSGPNGFRDSIPQPVVSVPGTYQLSATGVNGCTQIISYTIPTNTFPPGAQPTGGVLDCNPPALTLHCTTTPINATVKWSGPYGFLSNIRNPVVSRSGIYYVTVTNPTNGCTRIANTTVFDNGNAPQAFLTVEFIGAGRRRIACFTTAVAPAFVWTGPNGFASTEQNPVVITPGLYTVLVTDGISDCQAYESILVPAATSANGKTTGGRAAPVGEGWQMYPNPSPGQVQLRYGGDARPGQTYVTVLDGLGRIVAEQDLSDAVEATMDLGDLPEGLYRILLQSNQGVETKNLSIHH